jgi:DNA repair exonuclease SbcCD ATPase subunit
MSNEINRADGSAAAAGIDEVKSQRGAKSQGGESLDKVRDILFGSQAREYEKRFARLEERLLKEAADLREELKKRFDTLEAYTRKEVESLAARLKTEHEQRTESAKEISRELKETSRTLEKKTGQLDDQLITSQRELRQQILEQSKSISAEIRQKHEAMTAALERATAELRDEKTDRAALASLFMEVAMRLNNEFKIPDAEDLE